MPLFLTFCEQAEQKKTTLDGIRTRNPQIRSLMRYPLRHERKTIVGTKRGNPVRFAKRSQSKKCTLVVHTSLFEIFEHMREIIFPKCLLLKKSSLTGS